MINPVIPEDVNQFRCRSRESNYRERGEKGVPQAENSSELVSRPARHPVLAAENQYHVNSAGVKPVRPVVRHPVSRVLVNEFLLEIEDVRVVWLGDVVKVHLVHRSLVLDAFLTASSKRWRFAI